MNSTCDYGTTHAPCDAEVTRVITMEHPSRPSAERRMCLIHYAEACAAYANGHTASRPVRIA